MLFCLGIKRSLSELVSRPRMKVQIGFSINFMETEEKRQGKYTLYFIYTLSFRV